MIIANLELSQYGLTQCNSKPNLKGQCHEIFDFCFFDNSGAVTVYQPSGIPVLYTARGNLGTANDIFTRSPPPPPNFLAKLTYLGL